MDRTVAWRAAIVAGSLVLLWRILSINAVQYDQNGRPHSPPAATRAEIAARLEDNPADVRRVIELARIDLASSDVARARAALDRAVALAPIDRPVLEAQAALLLEQGRIGEAAAALSRIASLYGEHERIFPVFARMLAAGDPAIVTLALHDPRWVGPFVLDQCAKGTSGLVLAPLLRRAAKEGGGPKAAEIECVTRQLRQAGKWPEAYHVWLDSLARERLSEVGFVFNGSFEYPPTGVGFDWRPDRAAERESGHVAEFVPSREGSGQRALRVAYNGKRQLAPAVSQLLAVPPGHYRLTGRARVDRVSGPRGIRWVLRCASDDQIGVLGASERFVGSSEWAPFSFDVDIPPRCAGQVLQLEAVGMAEGTTFISGNVWFDDVALLAPH